MLFDNLILLFFLIVAWPLIKKESTMPQLKIKVSIDQTAGVITWEGLDFTVSVPDLLQIDEWEARSDLDRMSSCHGIKQKVNDARAGLTIAKGNTTQDMVNAMQEVVDHVAEGQWNKTKEGSKGKSLSLTNAISKMKELGKSTEEIRESLEWMFPAVDINTIKF